MNSEKLRKFKEFLKIDEPILAVCFTNDLPEKFHYYQDTACTALARSFKNQETLVFDVKNRPQLCPGANYFLKLAKVSNNETISTYVNNEHVFKNEKTCRKFINLLPKFPDHLKNKHVVIKQFKENDEPKIVVMLVNPAQAGRILGLLNYDKSEEIKILPNQPTCLSFFAPLITNQPHLNLIDYYDRYYQGKINKNYIWPEEKLIISLTFEQFNKILVNFEKSPQGSFKPNLNPQMVDKI